MGIEALQLYINQYGLFFLGLIIFIEYLNVPGFPAGIILPIAGIWAKGAGVSFLLAMFISVVSALLASWILYYVGLKGGELFFDKYLVKHPKFKPQINKCFNYIEKKESFGVFIAKLIPMIRTIIAIPAGVVKMNFFKYTVSSCLGIIVWNFALMSSGYFFGEAILTKLF